MSSSRNDTSNKNLSEIIASAIAEDRLYRVDLEKGNVESDDSTPSTVWSFSKGVPKSLVLFIAQIGFSTGISVFSVIKLAGVLTGSEKALYISMLTSQVSLWVPSPIQSFKKK